MAKASQSHEPILLLTYKGSPYALKTEYLLAHKRIPYIACPVSMLADDRSSLRDLDIAHRRIPILAIGSEIYFDSDLICRKLEELYPEPALGTAHHASLMSTAFVDGLFATYIRMLPRTRAAGRFTKDRAKTFPAAFAPDHDVAAFQTSFISQLYQLDQMLARQPYLLGEKISIADIGLVSILILSATALPELLPAAPFQKEHDTPLVNLKQYLQRTNAALLHAVREHKPHIIFLKEAALAGHFAKYPLKRIVQASFDVIRDPEVHKHRLQIGSPAAIRARDTKVISQEGKLVFLDATLIGLELPTKLRVWAPRGAYSLESSGAAKL